MFNTAEPTKAAPQAQPIANNNPALDFDINHVFNDDMEQKKPETNDAGFLGSSLQKNII